MRILFIGNSITAGNTGVSFISMIRREQPSWKLVNKGVNGEPLYNIAERLIACLRKDAAFDHIVIEAGINDVLLPVLESRGGLYKWTIRREQKHDIRPLADLKKFRNLYSVLLREARLYTKATITLLNLSRINEAAPDELLARQQSYNKVIAELAGQANYRLADVAAAFEAGLSGKTTQDYLCESFWNTSIWDGIRCKFPRQANRISRMRRLNLTIDGVHLNRSGAQLYADTIITVLKSPG